MKKFVYALVIFFMLGAPVQAGYIYTLKYNGAAADDGWCVDYVSMSFSVDNLLTSNLTTIPAGDLFDVVFETDYGDYSPYIDNVDVVYPQSLSPSPGIITHLSLPDSTEKGFAFYFQHELWDHVGTYYGLHSWTNTTIPNQTLTITSAPVPEPTTMLLFGAGLVGMAGFGSKKFKEEIKQFKKTPQEIG